MKVRKNTVMCGTGFSNSKGGSFTTHFGLHPANKPVKLYPDNMNKPFIVRFLEWWK